jgi:Fur family ferric uptake transcriptional regulator
MMTAEHIFQEAKLKSTSSRLEVLDVLLNSQNPLTHQEILKTLPVNFDRVTLYRVLDWLLENQLIHKVAASDRSWRFQFNHGFKRIQETESKKAIKYSTAPHHSHAHFQCSSCGKVFCLENVYPKLTNNIPSDFLVNSIELNITGTCLSCQP